MALLHKYISFVIVQTVGGGAIFGGGALVLSWCCVQGAWSTADGLRQKCRIASRSSLPRPQDDICGIFQGFW